MSLYFFIIASNSDLVHSCKRLFRLFSAAFLFSHFRGREKPLFVRRLKTKTAFFKVDILIINRSLAQICQAVFSIFFHRTHVDNDDAGRKPLRTVGMPFLTVFPSWKEILTVIFPLSAIIFVNIVFVDFDAVYGNEKEKFREEVGRRRKAVIGLSGLSALEKRHF